MTLAHAKSVHIPFLIPMVAGLCAVCGKSMVGDDLHMHHPDDPSISAEILVTFPEVFEGSAKDRFVKAIHDDILAGWVQEGHAIP